MKWTSLILALFLFSASCGKRVHSPGEEKKEKSIASAETLINDRKYTSAIEELEALLRLHPDDERIKIKLFHAYAGAGTFEALKVVGMWKKMEKVIKAPGKHKNDLKGKDLKIQALNLEARINRILAPLPILTSEEARRLDQAVSLYQELGLKVDNAGSYNNFKWGTIHLYRLALNAKIIMVEVDKTREQRGRFELKKLEKALLPRLSVMGQDIFMAYKLFGHSYEKIQKLTKAVDKLIAKAVENTEFRLKVDETVTDQTEFFMRFLSDNIEAATVIVKKISDLYSDANLGNLDGLSSLLPKQEEVEESEKNIERLIKVFLQNFSEKHPEFEDKVQNLFNDDFRKAVTGAMNKSIKVKSTKPLKHLFASKQHEIEVIVSYYRILRKEIHESDLNDSIREAIEPLRKKISLEALKDQQKKIEADIEALKNEKKGEASDERAQFLSSLELKKSEVSGQIKSLLDELRQQ